jgi:hypothetical protein
MRGAGVEFSGGEAPKEKARQFFVVAYPLRKRETGNVEWETTVRPQAGSTRGFKGRLVEQKLNRRCGVVRVPHAR